jgi:hypothetical protein
MPVRKSTADLFGPSKFAKQEDPLESGHMPGVAPPPPALNQKAPITKAAIKYRQKDGGLHTFHLNDRVTFLDGRQRAHTGAIVKFERAGIDNPYMYVTVREDEGSHFVELRRVVPAGTAMAQRMLAEAEAAQVTLHPGTLVRVTLARGKSYGGVADGDLAVVLADKGRLVNVAKLGGHGGAYARLSHSILHVVDPAEVVKGL